MPSNRRAALFQGIAFGVLMAAFMLVTDAIEGDVPRWPLAAVVYVGAAIVGGVLYGFIWGWLDRRSARRG